MKKAFYLAFLPLFSLGELCAQQWTSLYSENFNGGTHSFSLNSSSAGSAPSTVNSWVVNDAYTGGSVAASCLGFPLGNISVPNNNTQPAGIVGNPTSRYLHVLSAQAQASGVLNSNFQAADGACATAHNIFAGMSSDVSTLGYDTVEFRFWWQGYAGNGIYTELYYSTNQGGSWTLYPGQYNLNYDWQETVLRSTLWAGQANVRFGFRLVSAVGSGANSPAFGVDDIQISGWQNQTVDIQVGALSSMSLCSGSSAWVYFSTTGNFQAGNQFTAQLSDAAGNFGSPITLGTGSSPDSIAITLPLSLDPAGAYRLRVVSSQPNQASTNSIIVPINPQPSGGQISGNNSLCPGDTTQLSLSNYIGMVQWQVSTNGLSFTDLNGATANTYTSPALVQTSYYRAVLSTSCGSTFSDTLTAQVSAPVVPSWTYLYDTLNGVLRLENFTAGASQCLWTINGQDSLVNCDSVYVYVLGSASSYALRLQVTNGQGCQGSSTDTFLLNPTALTASALPKLQLFPNPNAGLWQVNWPWALPGQWQLFNGLGQMLGQGRLQEGLQAIQAQDLPNGLYFFRSRDAQGLESTQTIQIQR